MRKLKWQSAVAGDEWPEILELLGTLSVEMRTAIILKHYYGYSLEEIAEMADVPIGTVKSRIHSGLRIMRKELTAT